MKGLLSKTETRPSPIGPLPVVEDQTRVHITHTPKVGDICWGVLLPLSFSVFKEVIEMEVDMEYDKVIIPIRKDQILSIKIVGEPVDRMMVKFDVPLLTTSVILCSLRFKVNSRALGDFKVGPVEFVPITEFVSSFVKDPMAVYKRFIAKIPVLPSIGRSTTKDGRSAYIYCSEVGTMHHHTDTLPLTTLGVPSL